MYEQEAAEEGEHEQFEDEQDEEDGQNEGSPPQYGDEEDQQDLDS